MSTKRIRAILEAQRLATHCSTELIAEAQRDLEAIERACCVFLGESIPNVLPRDEAAKAWRVIQQVAEEAP